MKCRNKQIGLAALSFGSGVILTCVLPECALVFVTAVVIAGAGALILIT